MEQQREKPAWPVTATEPERAEARARFRRKLTETDARMTAEKRARALAVFGLDASAVE